MVTFILTYIGTSFVDSALSSDGFAFIPEIARRKVLVLLYFGSILAGVTLLGVLTVSVGGRREGIRAGKWESAGRWVDNTLAQADRCLSYGFGNCYDLSYCVCNPSKGDASTAHCSTNAVFC